MADIGGLRKSISEMSTEELMALVGETRNNRIEAQKPKPRKKSTKKKVAKKQLSMADLMSKIDDMTPEEAAAALASLDSNSEDDEEEDDDEEDPRNILLHGTDEEIRLTVCFELGFQYRKRNPHVRIDRTIKNESIGWKSWTRGWLEADRTDNSWRKSLLTES